MTHHCTKFSGHWKVSLQKTETQIHSSTSPEGPLNQFTSFFSPGFSFNTMPRLEGKNTLSPELLRATRLCLQTFWFFNHFHLLNICLLVSYRLLYRNRTGHKILTLQWYIINHVNASGYKCYSCFPNLGHLTTTKTQIYGFNLTANGITFTFSSLQLWLPSASYIAVCVSLPRSLSSTRSASRAVAMSSPPSAATWWSSASRPCAPSGWRAERE